MKLNRKLLSWTFCTFAILLVLIYFNRIKNWINVSYCDIGVTYKIGKIDEQFTLDSQEAAKYIQQAADIWNKTYHKTIFTNNQNGDITINFVYDGRHSMIQDIAATDNKISNSKDALATILRNYDIKKANLEKQVNELNEEIADWNSKGGAPENVYKELISKQKSLTNQINTLNSEVDKINNQISYINNDIKNLNNDVGQFNKVIDQKPEEGLYTTGIRTIDIYFYASKNELIHVLAHEFGHSLGLEHLPQSEAIMNLTSSSNINVAQADIDELTKVCSVKNRLDYFKDKLLGYYFNLINTAKSVSSQKDSYQLQAK